MTDMTIINAIANAVGAIPSGAIVSLPTFETEIVLTRNNTWIEVDLSAYGTGILGVWFYIKTQDDAAGQAIYFRPKDHADYVVYYHVAANQAQGVGFSLQTDINGIFEYKAQAGLTSATISIMAVVQT